MEFTKIGSQSAYLIDPQLRHIWQCMGCRLNQMVPNPSVRTICCPYTNFDDIMVWLNVGLEVFIGQVSKCRIEKLCMAYTSNSTKIFKRWNIGFDERVCFERGDSQQKDYNSLIHSFYSKQPRLNQEN